MCNCIICMPRTGTESMYEIITDNNTNYRNRFETWHDDYYNLKKLGFGHKEIMKRIGEGKNV